MVTAAKDLAVEASQWMSPSRAERVAREARDQAICTIASSCRPDERAELTRALRAAGALTPALLLRSLLGGERTLFTQALAELSGLPQPRVAAFILEPQGEGFAALARRAGLKGGVLLAFRAALAAIKAQGAEAGDSLKLPLVQKVIDTCEQLDDPALVKVRALLWRFAAEAAKAEAAHFAREAAAQAAVGRLPRALEFSPVNDDCRSRAEADRGLWLAADWRAHAGACGAARRIRARIKRRASNCRPSSSPGSTTRRKGQALAGASLAPSAISCRACAIACRSTEGSCAPGTPTRPPKMKNGTPLTPIA